MQWMVDGIHDFTVTDHQKNLLEELIIIISSSNRFFLLFRGSLVQ